MYRPDKGSLRDQICLVILERGEVTVQECIEILSTYRQGDVKGAITQLKNSHALLEDGGAYRLTDHIKRHYGVDVPEEVRPPEVPVSRFKAWTGKYDPLNSLNGGRIERRGFVTVSSKVPFYEY